MFFRNSAYCYGSELGEPEKENKVFGREKKGFSLRLEEGYRIGKGKRGEA